MISDRFKNDRPLVLELVRDVYEYCLDCSNNQKKEVERCWNKDCRLFKWRTDGHVIKPQNQILENNEEFPSKTLSKSDHSGDKVK
jgi:hypothetical protein